MRGGRAAAERGQVRRRRGPPGGEVGVVRPPGGGEGVHVVGHEFGGELWVEGQGGLGWIGLEVLTFIRDESKAGLVPEVASSTGAGAGAGAGADG